MYIHIHVILGQCTGGHATVSTGSCLTENTRHQPLYIWIGPDGQLGTLGIHAQILKYTQVAKMYAWNHLMWHLSSCMRVIGKIYGRLQLRTWAESTRKFQGSRVVEEPLQNECRERLKFNIIIVHSIRVITGWIFLFIFLEQGRIFTVNNWLISEVQLWSKCRIWGVFLTWNLMKFNGIFALKVLCHLLTRMVLVYLICEVGNPTCMTLHPAQVYQVWRCLHDCFATDVACNNVKKCKSGMRHWSSGLCVEHWPVISPLKKISSLELEWYHDTQVTNQVTTPPVIHTSTILSTP